MRKLIADNESLVDQTIHRLEGEIQESRVGDESDAFMKEDLFSSSSDNLVSVADEKQLSMDNLNSQFDGYKTTNAPDSNDKQHVEPLVRSPNLSNCERMHQDQKEKPRNPYKKSLISSNRVFGLSEMIFNGQSL